MSFARIRPTLAALVFLAVQPALALAALRWHDGGASDLRSLLAYLLASTLLLVSPERPGFFALMTLLATAATAVLPRESWAEAPVLPALALALAHARKHRAVAGAAFLAWGLLWWPSLRGTFVAHGGVETFEAPFLRGLRATFPACALLPILGVRGATPREPSPPLFALFALLALRGPAHPVALLGPVAAIFGSYLHSTHVRNGLPRSLIGGALVAGTALYLSSREFLDLAGPATRELLALPASTDTGTSAQGAGVPHASLALTVLTYGMFGSVLAFALRAPFVGLALATTVTLGWTTSLRGHVRTQTAQGARDAFDAARSPGAILLDLTKGAGMTPERAASWLIDEHADPKPERWLLTRRTDFPGLSFAHRKKHGVNLPAWYDDDAFVLARSDAPKGSASPLDVFVSGTEPGLLSGERVTFEDGITGLGVSFWDSRGNRVSGAAGGTFRVAIHLKVEKPLLQSHAYCTFLHIDHTPSRFSAEHRTLGYPMAYWLPGDVISDTFEVKLPTHFRKGTYAIFYGLGHLPCEDDRRMGVRGRGDGRASGGFLVVP